VGILKRIAPIAGRRVLVTGVGGLSGKHLVPRLRLRSPAAIVGLDREADVPIELDLYIKCDLTDPDAVLRAVLRARPDVVFHLAGIFGAASPELIWDVNVGGFAHLCAALRCYQQELGYPIRLVTVGSAAELGSAGAAELPVTEEASCLPETEYGKSKLAVTRLAQAEPTDGPLRIVIPRTFNLVGPGLSGRLALGNFARQIGAVSRGEGTAVRSGPLSTRRDFVDVRDAVEGYLDLAERGRAGQVYNVCAGRSYRIRDQLQKMIELAGGEIPVAQDQSCPRRGDLPDIYGDHAKITRETGWRPTIPMRRSLVDLMVSARAA
jgi:GDP-4-dehydro-6-deoxy-D-mannose reductase